MGFPMVFGDVSKGFLGFYGFFIEVHRFFPEGYPRVSKGSGVLCIFLGFLW